MRKQRRIPMDNTTAQQNMERSHETHWIQGKRISMDNMRGHRFAEVALFTGTSEENAVADFYNSTGVDDPTPARFIALDKDKLAQENKAIGVLLSPRRYWWFDEFRVFGAGGAQAFGAI